MPYTYRVQTLPGTCALVASVNARIRLGGGDISDDAFDKLIDVCRCRYGAANNALLATAWQTLGLNWLNPPSQFMAWEVVAHFVRHNFPIMTTVHHDLFGYHAVLVADATPDLTFRVTGMESLGDWFPAESMRVLTDGVPDSVRHTVLFAPLNVPVTGNAVWEAL